MRFLVSKKKRQRQREMRLLERIRFSTVNTVTEVQKGSSWRFNWYIARIWESVLVNEKAVVFNYSAKGGKGLGPSKLKYSLNSSRAFQRWSALDKVRIIELPWLNPMALYRERWDDIPLLSLNLPPPPDPQYHTLCFLKTLSAKERSIPDPARFACLKLSQNQPFSLIIYSVCRVLLLVSETRQTYSQNL